MRRVADLHPGQAKTDARDAYIIADTARTMSHTLRGITIADEHIAELSLLCGFDDDLTAQLTEQRADIEAEILTVVDAHPLTEVLTSMPGIGVRTAALILTEVVGKNFKSAAHLASYAGIAPVTRRSGTSIRGEAPSRRGNKTLRRALFLSAFASIKADPLSRAYYDRKRAEGKRYNQAIIALARRRTDVLYAMLRDGTLYEPRPTQQAPAA